MKMPKMMIALFGELAVKWRGTRKSRTRSKRRMSSRVEATIVIAICRGFAPLASCAAPCPNAADQRMKLLVEPYGFKVAVGTRPSELVVKVLRL
jgi:hypothetical protein